MKFIRNVVLAHLEGTVPEVELVRNLLTFDDNPSYLDSDSTLYSGLVDFVADQLYGQVPVEVEELVQYKHPPLNQITIPEDYLASSLEPGFCLRPYQINAARKALFKGRGILELATGAGKTEVAAIILKYLLSNGLAKKAYVITETRFLMHQAAGRFELRGLEEVHRFGGGHRFKPGPIQVCVSDSLVRAIKAGKMDVCADFADCDLIIWDEVQHLQSDTWVFIGEVCGAIYRYGLTATLWSDPFKYSYSDFKLIGLTGGVVSQIPSSVLRRQGYLAEPYVTFVEVNKPKVHGWKWDKYYEAGIVRHPQRNSYVTSIAWSLYDGFFKTLVFVNRINHGLLLVKTLRNLGCDNVYFVKGGEMIYEWRPSGRWDRRKTSIEEVAALVKDTPQIVVVGTSVLDEGVDFPSFQALIMCTAMMKYRRTVQRVGRGMRPKEGDNSVYVFDFDDATHPRLQDHSAYRAATYKVEEYSFLDTVEDAALKMCAPILIQDGLCKWREEEEEPKRRRRKSDD